MKRLHRYIIRSFIGPWILTFVLAMIVLILQFVWKYIDELVGKGLSWTIISELFLYLSAQLIPMALILSVLLASIMTFGNLGEHSELSAIKSSGVSLTRIMSPLLVLVIILMIGTAMFSDRVVPRANQKFFALMISIRQQRPEFDIKERQFVNDTRLEGYTLRIGKRTNQNNILHDIMVYDHTAKAGNVSVTVADSGHLVMTQDRKNLLLTLYNGYSYAERLDENNRITPNKPLQRNRFEMQQFLFNLPGSDLERIDEELYKANYRVKTMNELSDYVSALYRDLRYHRDKLSKDLMLTQLFRLDDKSDPRLPLTARQDSLALLRVNIDSLMDTADANSRRVAIGHALSYARSAHNLVTAGRERDQSKLRWIYRHQVEWHRKLTLAVACLIFFLIGAPLGAIIRKGGLGTPVVISTIFFIFYYVISLASEKYAQAGVLPVILGMWSSTIILLPLGIFLTIKTTRDSAIMNPDSYGLLLRKMTRLFKRGKHGSHENPSVNQ
ncbi:MAG: LptF/LptG family permease [Bacteroidales bacterium]|nr:LptF/LptG family permease [Bacteroidales bacterium]